MKLLFLILGIFCLIYYFIMAVYVRRLRFAFAWFWIILGGISFGLFGLTRVFDGGSFELIAGIIMIALLLLLTGGLLVVLRGGKNYPENGAKYIIVLGAKIYGTKVSRALIYRLDTAIKALNGREDVKLILSGGKGKDEDISEAEAMKNYMLSKGVPESALIMEDRSTSTYTNFVNSAVILGSKDIPVSFVSNSFHIYRAGKIAREVGFTSLHAIPAKSSAVSWLNNAGREAVGIICHRALNVIWYHGHEQKSVMTEEEAKSRR